MTAPARERETAASVSGDDLRALLRAHLALHPVLTAYEAARALRLPRGGDRVRRLLTARTPTGNPRYFAVEVHALLGGETTERARELAEAERDQMTGGGP